MNRSPTIAAAMMAGLLIAPEAWAWAGSHRDLAPAPGCDRIRLSPGYGWRPERHYRVGVGGIIIVDKRFGDWLRRRGLCTRDTRAWRWW